MLCETIGPFFQSRRVKVARQDVYHPGEFSFLIHLAMFLDPYPYQLNQSTSSIRHGQIIRRAGTQKTVSICFVRNASTWNQLQGEINLFLLNNVLALENLAGPSTTPTGKDTWVGCSVLEDLYCLTPAQICANIMWGPLAFLPSMLTNSCCLKDQCISAVATAQEIGSQNIQLGGDLLI